MIPRDGLGMEDGLSPLRHRTAEKIEDCCQPTDYIPYMLKEQLFLLMCFFSSIDINTCVLFF